MLSLDVAPPQQILEIISTIPENGSETDSNQNEKKKFLRKFEKQSLFFK